MEKAKHGKEPTQNNIAFVMQLEQENEKRLVFRFQQCLASICQHASIGLTIHIFANSLGKDESTKVLDVLTAECLNGLKVKFYDIEQVLPKLLPSINIIKVSELYCTWFRPGAGVVTCSACRQLQVSEKAGERGGIEGGGGATLEPPPPFTLALDCKQSFFCCEIRRANAKKSRGDRLAGCGEVVRRKSRGRQPPTHSVSSVFA